MTNNPNIPVWFDSGRQYVWYPYTQEKIAPAPLPIISTNGCKILLADGRELIDGTSSWWSACHGYNNPHIKQAIEKQLVTLPHFMFAGIAHEQAYKLAGRLSKMSGLEKVFFTDSGSTAIETAMKMAVQYWKNKGDKKRNKFFSFLHGYHGDTMGGMSLCDPDHGMHKQLNDYMPKQYCIRLPLDEYDFSEFDMLLEGIGHEVAGVVIEPLVQGAGGMKFHSADVLAEIHRITKKHGILFIADEVMTGFYRTGSLFACNEAGIVPDIMCIGKALTGGTMTLAATLASQDVYNAFLGDSLERALMSGPTYMANPLACAAANASIDLFEFEPRQKQVEAIERQLYAELMPCKELARVLDVRVKGAIGVVEMEISRDEILSMREKFIELGVFLRPFSNVVYIIPPFIVEKEELTKLTGSVISAIANLRK
jgi:adenosylmethionine-8-amino-7-oxononanoate aminotransferase